MENNILSDLEKLLSKYNKERKNPVDEFHSNVLFGQISALKEAIKIVENSIKSVISSVASSCSCDVPYKETKIADIPYDTDDTVYYIDILIHHCPKCGIIDRIEEY